MCAKYDFYIFILSDLELSWPFDLKIDSSSTYDRVNHPTKFELCTTSNFKQIGCTWPTDGQTDRGEDCV